MTVRGGRFLEAPLVGTLLQEQDNERQLPIVLTSGDFSLYEDCIPYFDSFTKKHFYIGSQMFWGLHLIITEYYNIVNYSLADNFLKDNY